MHIIHLRLSSEYYGENPEEIEIIRNVRAAGGGLRGIWTVVSNMVSGNITTLFSHYQCTFLYNFFV